MAGPTARVSLVVPVHHCHGHLEELLAELDRFLHDAPPATELVLVDDRGRDPNASAELRRFAERPHVRKGVEITMLTTPTASRQVSSPLEVASEGVLLRPLKTFALH